MKTIMLLCLLLPTVAAGDIICGDANDDETVNVGDAVFLINTVFKGGPASDPVCVSDANGDSITDVGDAVYLINFTFKDGNPPVEPCCPDTGTPTYEILFIGSSYFGFNNLPGMMRDMIDSAGKTVDIQTAITYGLYLADHAALSSTEVKINERDWDFVFLQGVGSLTAYPDSFPDDHPVYPALVTLNNKILSNCASTKVVFCLPWAFEDGMIWVSGWTDEYPEMQEKAYVNTLAYSESIGFVVSPVGWSWNTVLREQNYPLHYLHLSDWNHPSLKGSYLMACTIFSTIYQESTVGNGFYAGIAEQEATYFQSVASSMVLDSLELWHIE